MDPETYRNQWIRKNQAMSKKLKEEPPVVAGGAQAEAPLLSSHYQPVYADPESPAQKEAQSHSCIQKALQNLAGVQLGLSIAIFMQAVGCAIMAGTTFGFRWSNYMFLPYDGTGIWGGILAMIAGNLGIVATQSPHRGRHLMVTYAVLSLVVCVGMGILIITSSVWMSRSGLIGHVVYGLLVTEAAAHLVCTVVSLCLICEMWKKTGGCWCFKADGDERSFTYTPAAHITHPQETGNSQIKMNAEKSGGDHGDLPQVHQISGVQLEFTEIHTGLTAPLPPYFEQ